MLLSQDLLPIVICLLAHLAEQVVPACSQRGDAAGFLILWSTDTVPSVDVQKFALECHLLPRDQLVLAELLRVLALGGLGRAFS